MGTACARHAMCESAFTVFIFCSGVLLRLLPSFAAVFYLDGDFDRFGSLKEELKLF